jgi:hypothetical protein
VKALNMVMSISKSRKGKEKARSFITYAGKKRWTRVFDFEEETRDERPLNSCAISEEDIHRPLILVWKQELEEILSKDTNSQPVTDNTSQDIPLRN